MSKETQSATGAESVDVSSNDAVLKRTARAVYVGGTGDVALTTPEGDTVTFVSVTGTLSVQADVIKNVNTTATDIVVLY